MAAKKKTTGTSNSVDAAAKAIEKRYGDKYVAEGSRTLAAYTSALKDVVAESPLYETFSKSTLNAAASKVAKKQWVTHWKGMMADVQPKRGRNQKR